MRQRRDSEWMVLRRCLILVQRLLRGPASRTELVAAVREALGEDAYPPSPKDGERISAFEKDINRRLPENMGMQVGFNRRTGLYELREFSGLPGFDLPEEALAALAFLQDTFAPGTPHHERIQALANHLHACLPEARREALARQRVAPRVDLRRLDPGAIAPRVEQQVARALAQRRLLRFTYRSPLYEDGVPRRHTVEPYDLYFDTQRRHQYLYAFCREVDGGPEGPQAVRDYIRYRMDRILPEQIEVLESKLAPLAPRPKRYRLVYRLAPAIARHGEVTQHFEEMQVTLADDGSAEVEATVDNLFFAVRTLLHYGDNCQVLGGPEALREMRAIVQGMAKLYDIS